MNRFIEEKFLPLSMKILEQRHLRAIRDGLIISMALLIVDSIFIVICQLPIDAYQDFMANVFGDGFKNLVWNTIDPATTGLIGLMAAFGVCNEFVKNEKIHGSEVAGFVSVAAYLTLCPPAAEGGYGSEPLGSNGLFLAMITALLVAEIYSRLVKRNIVIKMPDAVPPAVSASFTSLIPAAVILTLALCVRLLMSITPYETAQALIYTIVQAPLTVFGTSLAGNIVAGVGNGLFWIFGLHGQTIVGSIFNPLWKAAQLENLDFFKAGLEVPNIITSQFMLCNVWIGGGGATLPLVVWMFFFGKSKQVKQIARVAIVPSIFNINEPIIFGLPIVLNPTLAIPFILSPVVLVIFDYVTISMGIFPRLVGIAVPWTCPMIFSGYLATGAHIGGAIIQILNFIIAFAIYMPFAMAWDKQKLAEEKGESIQEIEAQEAM